MDEERVIKSNRIMFFAALALVALLLLGASSMQPAKYSDLQSSALRIAEESKLEVTGIDQKAAGVLLRANVVK